MFRACTVTLVTCQKVNHGIEGIVGNRLAEGVRGDRRILIQETVLNTV